MSRNRKDNMTLYNVEIIGTIKTNYAVEADSWGDAIQVAIRDFTDENGDGHELEVGQVVEFGE